MDTLILIYFIALSMELVLSVGMLVLLWLIIAPRGARSSAAAPPATPARPLPQSPAAALNAAFQSVSQDGGELAVLLHARHVLARSIAERH